MDSDLFRALADPHRRALLDALFLRDGRTLGELCALLPRITRFGVMKHLRVLEKAGLVTARKAGREKLHYLNPVPIRLIHDRWISKFTEPWVGALADLKHRLEVPMSSDTVPARPKRVYEVYIRTTPERLWEAIVSGETTPLYYFGAIVESDWRPRSPYRYRMPDGSVTIAGTLLEVDPPRRLVMTFAARWDAEVAADAPTRVTWEIEPLGEACKLTLVHDEFDGETATFHQVEGWSQILSGLKTLLETGKPLVVGGES